MQPRNPLNDFLISLAAELTVKLIELTADRLKGDPEQQAMRRVYRQAFEDMLVPFAALDEDNQRLLAAIMQGFVASPGVAQRLLDLAILKEAPPWGELRVAFEVLGYDPATLGVGFDDLLTALVEALEDAIRDEASRDGSPLKNQLVVRSLSGLLDELRQTRQDILTAIQRGQEELQRLFSRLGIQVGDLINVQGVAIGENNTVNYISNQYGLTLEQMLEIIKALKPDRIQDYSTVAAPYLGILHHEAMQSGLLRTLDVRTKDPTFAGRQVTVDQVYTPLDTGSRVHRNDEGHIVWENMGRNTESMLRDEETEPLSAMEAANHFDRLVVLGDPGSGKSTFVGFLSLCLTGYLLDPESGWLDRLRQQGWEQGALLPVYVTLGNFAQDMGEPELHGSAQSVLGHIERMLEQCGCPEAMAAVKGAMVDGQALLILDGLDEVPAERRETVRDAVEMVVQAFERCRVLLTCRILSYANPEWQIPCTETVTLAPFDEEKIQHFIRAWYTASETIGLIDHHTAQSRTTDLAAAVGDPRLQDMAKNPMLLTVMALVHSFHEGKLPRETARLYNKCVELLMLEWKPDDAIHLAKVLELPDETDLYRILWQIAYEAHEKQSDREGAADIPRQEVMSIAAEEHLGDWGKAQLFCDYVEERAGLLIGRGGEDGKRRVYAFPHRTFQEYLAGCYMADEVDFAGLIDEKARAGANWRQVVLLSTGHMYFNKTDRNQPLLAVQFILQDEPESYEDWQAVALAGEMLLLMGLAAVGKHKLGRQMLSLARERLAALVGEGHLEPVERAAAGRSLSALGDPREGVGVKDRLPDIAWVDIPGVGGWHLLTDEGDKGTYNIAPFRMAKYPVTYAQFQALLDDPEGWPNPRWWAGLDAREDHRAAPGEQAFKYDNHPRERVSWWDAMAFCAWLSIRLGCEQTLNEWLEAGKDWREYPGVRLPAEWEWQWAAQGPDGHEYPYEGPFDPAKGNTYETGIGQTSAVGIFPQGASPYGVLDMSGNVWEWCLNEDANFDPENTALGGSEARVLRGGSWGINQVSARASFRFRYLPFFRSFILGFRVARSYLKK